jgi:hypothetical protein
MMMRSPNSVRIDRRHISNLPRQILPATESV